MVDSSIRKGIDTFDALGPMFTMIGAAPEWATLAAAGEGYRTVSNSLGDAAMASGILDEPTRVPRVAEPMTRMSPPPKHSRVIEVRCTEVLRKQ